jgi:hypothetical protein
MSTWARKPAPWIAATLGILAMSGLVFWQRSSDRSAIGAPPAAAPSPARDPQIAEAIDAKAGQREPVAVDASAAQEAPVDLEPAASSADPVAMLARARDALRSELEASVFDSLDPNAILDAAFSLGSLEVDPRPYSEPDPSGCTVYSLMGAPDGMRAELWVGRSSKPEVAQVLSLRFELDPDAAPYMLDGCARAKAIAQVQMQIAQDGTPLNLSILTDLPPSARNREHGVSLEVGSISQGVLCFLDAREPDNWSARTHGLEDGKPGSWENSTLALAGQWPAPDKLVAFSDLLQRQYATIHH